MKKKVWMRRGLAVTGILLVLACALRNGSELPSKSLQNKISPASKPGFFASIGEFAAADEFSNQRFAVDQLLVDRCGLLQNLKQIPDLFLCFVIQLL